jgi:hypothetical protein
MRETPTTRTSLVELHKQVHACVACVGKPGCGITADASRVRRLVPQVVRSEVLLVGEALGPARMERLWSLAVATGGNRWQMGTP